MKNKMFDTEKWYIIRADKAGVFIGKIAFIEGSTIGVKAIRRLYYWKGALDVTQIARCGVADPGSCKFSDQLSSNDLSVVTELIEFHPLTEEALASINSVPVWKAK